MSTRSRIGMQLPDGRIESIYCHFDGYPSGVGTTLNKFYTDPEKVEDLINLGDISQLGEDIDSTVAYHRDRNEPYAKPRYDATLGVFKRRGWEEFGYVFTRDGEWVMFK